MLEELKAQAALTMERLEEAEVTIELQSDRIHTLVSYNLGLQDYRLILSFRHQTVQDSPLTGTEL